MTSETLTQELLAYLKDREIKLPVFTAAVRARLKAMGEDSDLSVRSMQRYASGDRMPDAVLCEAIRLETKDQVTAAELVAAVMRRRRERAAQRRRRKAA